MKLLLLGLLALVIVGYTAFTLLRPGTATSFLSRSNKVESVQAEPIRQAKKIYQDKKAQKTDFEKSPCLSEDMGGGWSLDITHNPRQPIDDEEQCQQFVNGTTNHLIEMTPDGNIVRVQ